MTIRGARREWSSTGSLFFGLLALCSCRTEPSSPLDASVKTTPVAGRVLALEDAGERWRPALEALRAAVDAGDEREARSVLERLYLAEPTGAALELARAYETILDGREAVASLALAIDAQYRRGPAGAGEIVVWFDAASRDPRALDVALGPCTLRVTQVSVDSVGDETKSFETMPVEAQIRVLLKEGTPVRIPLAQMPFNARKGALASRATFELEARAGAITVDSRELPAMRWRIDSGEVVLLASDLSALDLAASGALAEHVAQGKADARAALSIAVRLPRSERAAALDALARAVETIPEPALAALAPALRWLAPEPNLGRDPDSWRAFLRARARALLKRPELILPRARRSALAGT